MRYGKVMYSLPNLVVGKIYKANDDGYLIDNRNYKISGTSVIESTEIEYAIQEDLDLTGRYLRVLVIKPNNINARIGDILYISSKSTCNNITTKDTHKWSFALRSNYYKLLPDDYTPSETIDQFKKGDYIVTLKVKDNKMTYNCARNNYCFKQRLNSKGIYPEVDLSGTTENGHDVMSFDKNWFLEYWRYATTEEIARYDKLGKPYDVTSSDGLDAANGFVLPEKWFIRVTKDTIDIINTYRQTLKNHNAPLVLNGYEFYGIYNSDGIPSGFLKINDQVEITFEQFQRYVLKQPIAKKDGHFNYHIGVPISNPEIVKKYAYFCGTAADNNPVDVYIRPICIVPSLVDYDLDLKLVDLKLPDFSVKPEKIETIKVETYNLNFN